MKKILTTIMLTIFICNVIYATDGPVTTASSVTVNTGDLVLVPVTVANFTNVGGISLTLNYDASFLQFQDVILNPAFSTINVNGIEPGVFIFGYFSSEEVDLGGTDILFTLEFSYTGPPEGGSSLITWPELPSEANEYSTPDGISYDRDPFDEFFIEGTVTVIESSSPLVLTCPGEMTEASCQDQAEIDMSFQAWLNSAQMSGGVNPVLTNNSTGAPSACGGSATVTFMATSQGEDPVTCSSTFTVETAVVDACPPASTTTPVIDGIVDPSYQFLKTVSAGIVQGRNYTRGTLYKFEDATTLYLAYVESRGVNDNVYGPLLSDVNYSGWTVTHSFDKLLTGNKLRIQILNPGLVFDQSLDYLFKQTLSCTISYNSGLKKFASPGAKISGYDGSESGSLGYSSITAAETSCDFNQTCGIGNYNSNSPGPPEVTGCWEYRMVYEVAILKSGIGNPETVTASMIQVPQGYNSPAKCATAINGFKYCDGNADGSRNDDETGLEGWTFLLEGTDDGSAVTDANGYYEFFNIPVGSYSLSEVDQAGYIQTQNPAPFQLISGQVAQDRDFGNRPSLVTLSCPAPMVVEACQSQEEVDDVFASWLSSAIVTGGCNTSLENDNTGAPPASGGTTTVSFTALNCGEPVTCQSVFTVNAPMTCPPASTATPVADGLLDDSYQFFKNINLSAAGNNLYSRATLYKFEDAGYLWLAIVESRGVNDNVYGNCLSDVSYAGWGSKIHKFSDLLSSDKIQVQLYNSNSSKVFDVTFDYLFKQTTKCDYTYNSGLLKFAPQGSTVSYYDGSKTTAPGYNNVISAETSEDYNQSCNYSSYATNSPYPESGCWEYRVIYEIKISKAGLGLPPIISDTSLIRVPSVNNSPSKSTTAIQGFLYCDANNNGLRNAGEVGLGGWTINLAGPVNASTTTNAEGFYEFFYIPSGNYTITEVSQTGYVQTQSPAAFSLSATQVARDRNFGNWPAECTEEQATPAPLPLLADFNDVTELAVDIVPNPFNITTEVRVTTPVTTRVTVEIYNIQGIKLLTLFEGIAEANVPASYRLSASDTGYSQILLCAVRTQQGGVVKKIVRIR
jgi:hypothetical protein